MVEIGKDTFNPTSFIDSFSALDFLDDASGNYIYKPHYSFFAFLAGNCSWVLNRIYQGFWCVLFVVIVAAEP